MKTLTRVPGQRALYVLSDSSWGSTSNAAKKDPQKKAVPKQTRNIGGKKRTKSNAPNPYQKRMA